MDSIRPLILAMCGVEIQDECSSISRKVSRPRRLKLIHSLVTGLVYELTSRWMLDVLSTPPSTTARSKARSYREWDCSRPRKACGFVRGPWQGSSQPVAPVLTRFLDFEISRK